jgi:V-type H+-transporting ATPase subunit a
MTPGEFLESNIIKKKLSLLDEDYSESELNFISGVIKAEDDMKFKRMLFRASRGRAIPTFFDLTIENRALQIKQEKKIFIIFLQGQQNTLLFQKMLNICDLFGASRFNIPQKEQLSEEISNLQHEIFDKKTYLKSIETSIKDFFKDKIGENGIPGKYDMYKLYLLQEKLLFINLNKCKLIGDFLDGEVWIPQEKYNTVQNALLNITKKDPTKLTGVLDDIIDDNKINPPTYFKLTDFSYPFQTIVNEYGIPRYREINPGLFTIITFPFMFGVMFGDIGHGGLLTLFGLWLVLKKHEILKNFPFLKNLVKNRYFFLFLGFFAFYNGIIYNDFFAIPLGIFGSCYKNVKKNGKIVANRKNNCVYPIGLDPKWYSAVNELSFLNSFKMKMSVIIGVLQMILGLLLKGLNGIFFRDYADFLFEFIPQLIFMCLLFGYMILMIYIKWGTDWSEDTSKAPSIITQLLMIFLNMGSTGPEDNKTPLFHRNDYSYQEKFQYNALIISVICIPIMLLIKPIIEYFKLSNDKNENINNNEESLIKNKIGITDLAVNQIIETIEYVLGTVSHTASYLRLWALSLAHAQLAKVFFDITLLGNIQSGNIFGMFAGFFLLANITLGVLMGMDLLECALHTLRLHWVEFQSKFYHADGYPFTPYSFKYINDEFI